MSWEQRAVNGVSSVSEAIYRLLREDANDAPVPARKIANECGIAVGTEVENQRRKVRIFVRELRDCGHRICGDNDGYWIARSHDEWAAYLESVKSGARYRFVTEKQMRDAATHRGNEQGSLFDTKPTTDWAKQ